MGTQSGNRPLAGPMIAPLNTAASMSALPPKADIGSTCQDVRFVPKADSCTAATAGEVLPNFRQHLAWAEGLRNVIITARCPE
jgi:hypothetical protein